MTDIPKRSDLVLITKPYLKLWKAIALILIENDLDEVASTLHIESNY